MIIPLETMTNNADRFFNLTATAWTAISVLVGVISVSILSVFNSRYLRNAKQQSEQMAEQVNVSTRQAKAAEESLSELRQQFFRERVAEEELAYQVLRNAADNALKWKEGLHVGGSSASDQIVLKPDNWDVLVRFVALYRPAVITEIRLFATQMTMMEVKLKRYASISQQQRTTSLLSAIRQIDLDLMELVHSMTKVEKSLRNWGKTV